MVRLTTLKKAVERFHERIIRGLPRPGEIQDDPLGKAHRSTSLEMNSRSLSIWMRFGTPDWATTRLRGGTTSQPL